jgi:hypothetical protein
MRIGLSIHHHKALDVGVVAPLPLMGSASTRFGDEEGRFGLSVFFFQGCRCGWVDPTFVVCVRACGCAWMHRKLGLFVDFKERITVVMATSPHKQKITHTHGDLESATFESRKTQNC